MHNFVEFVFVWHLQITFSRLRFNMVRWPSLVHPFKVVVHGRSYVCRPFQLLIHVYIILVGHRVPASSPTAKWTTHSYLIWKLIQLEQYEHNGWWTRTGKWEKCGGRYHLTYRIITRNENHSNGNTLVHACTPTPAPATGRHNKSLYK